MSTSPSWFDQDKFSRLVKKVGPKSASATGVPAAAPRPPAKEAAPAPVPPSSFVSPVPARRSPISQPKRVSPPAPEPVEETAAPEPIPQPSEPSLNLPGATAEPAIEETPSTQQRRTSPLPDLKPIFEYDKTPVRSPSQSQPLPGRPALSPPAPASETFGLRDLPAGFLPFEEKEKEKEVPPAPEPESKAAEFKPEVFQSAPTAEDLATAWATVSSLNEELTRTVGERDEARREAEVLRSQMQETDNTAKERDELTAQVEQHSRAAEDARNESNLLRAQLLRQEESQASASQASPEELARALEERDSARRDYAGLREQFETMKLEQVRLRGEPPKKDPALQEELESLRRQLSERDEEIKTLREEASAAADKPAENSGPDADALQAQATQAREEASIAQRGLALSQKALQETRDALREASEGSSMTRTNLENLKNECATLVQQNMLLQAQHDQITRELNALKAKAAGRP